MTDFKIWHKQECFKGRGGIHGSDWAGWGFEKNLLGLNTYTVTQANNLSTNQIIAAPVFRRDPPEIFSPMEPLLPDTFHVLARGIPALSPPLGATSVNIPDP